MGREKGDGERRENRVGNFEPEGKRQTAKKNFERSRIKKEDAEMRRKSLSKWREIAEHGWRRRQQDRLGGS